MIYKFDPNELIYTKDTKRIKFAILGLMCLLLITFLAGRYSRIETLDKYEKELVLLNLQQEKNKFTEEKLIDLLKELNVKFPYIVLAQAKLETGNFKSNVFKQNNNLFGMKEARVRVKTAKGTNLNHAYYDNWQESVYDYAFYQCRYMSRARTEAEYFAALDASYAEANYYSGTLKGIIKKENLKEIFK
jgi:hypothetical protein